MCSTLFVFLDKGQQNYGSLSARYNIYILMTVAFHDVVVEIIISVWVKFAGSTWHFFLGKAFEAVASWTLAVLMALIIIPLGLPAAIIVSWSSWGGASSSAKWWHSQLAKGQLEEDEEDDDVDVLMLY